MFRTGAEDTYFDMKKTVNCRGRLLDFSTPAVMGILNFTPDSFHSSSRIANQTDAIREAGKMAEQGATILDLGGQSTRPGAIYLTAAEEWERLAPALAGIRKEFPSIFISVDTFHGDVAKRSIAEGADIINDISGGTMDPLMFDTIAALQVPYVLSHIRGTPETMHRNVQYDDVVYEVLNET